MITIGNRAYELSHIVAAMEHILIIVLAIAALCLIYDLLMDDKAKERLKPPKHGGF